MPVRVLHLISDTNIGGAGRQLLNFAKYHDRGLLDLVVVCPPGSLLAPPCRELGVRVEELPQMPGDESLNPAALISQLPALVSFIRREGIGLVHTHACFAGRLAARLAGVPVVYTRHCLEPADGRGGLKWRAWRWLNNRTADRVIAVSQAVRCNLIELGAASEQIEVIYNGIDLEEFQPTGRVEREWPAPAVGVVARLAPEKGHRCLLQAAGKVLERCGDVRFVIVGAGPLEEDLRSVARRLGLADRVIFTGLRRDIPRVLEQLDILVQPSLSEAQSLSLVEGMAMARPCVASAVGGVTEVISDGVDGLLVPPADPDALAEKLLALLNDPVSAARLGRAAALSARRRFDARVMAQRITELYLRLVQA